MDVSDPKTRFYRWIVLGCSFLVISTSNGMIIAGPSVFDSLILAELGGADGIPIPVKDLKLRDAIHMLVTLCLGIFAGALADRVGVKPLMIFGLALLAGCAFLYGRVQTLTDIYWIHAGFGVVLTTAGMIVNVMLISQWFTRNRGLAMGIMLAGSSVGNALIPQLNVVLLELLGSWRSAFSTSAFLPVFMLILVVVLIRSRPPGQSQENILSPPGERPVGCSLLEALLSRNFWVLSVIAFGSFFSLLAMSANSVLVLQSQGLSLSEAAFGPTVLFIGGLAGKLISGYLAEKLGHKRVLMGGLALMFGGCLAMVWGTMAGHQTSLFIGLAIFGFGWGGLYTLIQLLVADLFGLLALGKILGAINVVDTLGGGLGPVVTGALYDAYSNWSVPLAVMSGLLLTATLASFLLNTDAIERNDES